MSYFLRLVQNEWMKATSKRQTTFYLVFLLCMIAGLGILMRFVIVKDPNALSPLEFMQLVSSISMLITFYYLIVVSALTFTDEFKDGTIKQLLIRPASRNMILGSKIVNLIIITIVMNLFILLFASTTGFLLFKGENTTTIGDTIEMLLFIFPELAFYSLLAIMVAVVTRSVGLAISIPIIIQSVIASLASLISDKAWYKLLIFPNMEWAPFFKEDGGLPYPGATFGLSLAIYGGYMLILLLVTIWVLNKRDVQ